MKRGTPPFGGEFDFAKFHVAEDMDFLCNHLRLRRNSIATEPCFRCECNRTTLPWSDIRPSVRIPCPLRSVFFFGRSTSCSVVAGAVSICTNLAYDPFHIWRLGFARHVLGSIFYMLMFDVGLRGALSERVAVVWERVRLSCGHLR